MGLCPARCHSKQPIAGEASTSGSAKSWPFSGLYSWQTLGLAGILAAAFVWLPAPQDAAARVSIAEAGDVLSGVPRIIDGDTLQIGDERVRLYGVDAPETKQTCTSGQGQPYACGETASSALKKRVGAASMSCQVKAKDLYQRNVSACTVQGVGDIGHWLVENGYAVAYREYSKTYVEDEERAKQGHKGIWQGDFQIPAEWRREKKGKGPSAKRGALAALPGVLSKKREAQHPSGCEIKGNISSQGGHIYHVPGGRYYEAVKIEPSKGEKFFCSEAEAQDNGFRKSRE